MILSRNRNYSRLATAFPLNRTQNNLARAGGIRTPEARQCTKISTTYKTTSSSTFRSIRFPCFDAKHAPQTGNFCLSTFNCKGLPHKVTNCSCHKAPAASLTGCNVSFKHLFISL